MSPVQAGDKAACVAHLRDKDIHDGTLLIPFPYTLQHADEWLVRQIKASLREERETTLAIRQADGFLIGVASLTIDAAPQQHRGEIGYWLAKPFWGRGIATAAVGRLARHGWEELGLTRIYAEVFASNSASIRVLEKNRFRCEGTLRGHFRKHDAIIDALVFGLLKTDLAAGSVTSSARS